jgi:hypothetical protein
MPATVKTTRSAGGTQLLSVDDLSAGLDLVKAPTLLKANRSRVCRNWSLREPGTLIVCPGWLTRSTTSLGNARAQGVRRIYLGSGSPFMLGGYAGSVYKPSDSFVWGSAVSTGWSSSNEIYFPYDRDIVAILDGATAAKKSVDGTTWTNLGIAAPAAAPTSANLAGGSLVSGNVYQFSYAGRDDALVHEGNESATVNHTPSGGNLSVRLSLPFHPDTQVDTLTVYGRDVTAGESVRRRIGTVANPPSGTATYDVTSNSWGSGAEAPSDHDVPPLLSFGVVWKNRWWARHATIKNRIHFTQVFEPQSWGASFYIDIPFERGDDITAVVPLGDVLLLWGQSRIFLIIGQTSLDFEVRPSGASQAGALGPRAVDVVEDGAVHASADGIYLFDGATDRLLSNDIDGSSPSAVGWRAYVTTASATVLGKTPLIYDAASKQVNIGATNLYPFGTAGEWQLDLNRTRLQNISAWTTTDRAIGGYMAWDGNEPTAGNRGRLFSWDLTTGQINEERTGTTANGSDLVADYHGPVFTAGVYNARFPQAFVEYEPNDGDVAFEVLVDGTSLGAQSVDIGAGLARYGTGTYGTAQYGSVSRMQTPLDLPLEAEGHAIQARVAYTGSAAFRWFGYRLSLVSESDPRGM